MLQKVLLFSPDECAEIIGALKGLIHHKCGDNYKKHIWPDSPTLLSCSRPTYIRDNAACKVHEGARRLANYGSLLLDINLFYVRWAFPGETRDGNEPLRSKILSPGHYDDYKIDSLSVWVTFKDTTPATGSFWWSEDKELINFYKEKREYQLPPYFHENWSKDVEELHSKINIEYCKAGEALIFGPDLLHGSTTATTQERLTYDFRLLRSKK